MAMAFAARIFHRISRGVVRVAMCLPFVDVLQLQLSSMADGVRGICFFSIALAQKNTLVLSSLEAGTLLVTRN